MILKNVKYVNHEKLTEHTIEGPLLNKKAVCEGIAKSVKYLLNKKSIECELVTGKLREDSSVLHAWNVVKIDGNWYHLDVTANLGLSRKGIYRHDYFNLSDQEISLDHVIMDSPVSCRISNDSYYHRKKLVFSTQDQFVKILSKRLLFRQTSLVFKLPSSKDPESVVDLIFENTEKAIDRSIWHYKHMVIYPNISQLVFTIIVS